MSRRKTTEEFIKEAKKAHGDKYDYSKVIYKNIKTKVIVICPVHSNFLQRPDHHLAGHGCFECMSNSYKLGKEAFVKKANKVHKGFYTYSKVSYTNNYTNVLITCPKHKDFSQAPNKHIRGQGCPSCAIAYRSEIYKNTSIGWTYSNWEKAGHTSNNFDSFKLYIIKCYNKELGVYFYKIGRTFKKLNYRYSKGNLPYDYETIYIHVSDDAKSICELEQKYKNKCINYKYTPKKEFAGMTECYTSIDPLNLNLEAK